MNSARHAEPTAAAAGCASPSVKRMTDRARRPRGSAVGNPVIFAPVPEHAKQIVIDTADALGISQAAALEAILLALPLSNDGVPQLIDRRAYARRRQEELPIPAA
jgi:hypothetical protein